ncbi:hypothetical protein GYH30_054927 [Glycine max]|nr:hypothetical protein GYH30_054927 [Glycine max]
MTKTLNQHHHQFKNHVSEDGDNHSVNKNHVFEDAETKSYGTDEEEGTLPHAWMKKVELPTFEGIEPLS